MTALGGSARGNAPANYTVREALHLFELRAELEQDQIDASGFELREPFGDLLRRSHQA